MHPVIAPSEFRPPLERYTFFVDRERQAWRVSSDNAYLIPNPSTSDFHHWDPNLLARMCRISWDEFRTTINRILYPQNTEWNAVQRKRQSADEFQTLQQYLTWNQGLNSNLQQMLKTIFPVYNEWIRLMVLTPGCSFRFMGLDHEVPQHTTLPLDVLQEVYEALITSTSQGDSINPAPSKFISLYNQRDRSAHHMCTVIEVILDFYNASVDNPLSGEVHFLWQGWSHEAVLRYLSAYIADMEHTFRNVLGYHTLEPNLRTQLQLLVGHVHALCCDIASAHQWTCPATPTFTFQTFSHQETEYITDRPTINFRTVLHPIDLTQVHGT